MTLYYSTVQWDTGYAGDIFTKRIQPQAIAFSYIGAPM